MNDLTEEERRKVRLAGNLARGIRYVLILALACVLALGALGIYIHFTGAN